MNMRIERAVQIARELAAKKKVYKALDLDVQITELLAAAHSSFFGLAGDYWIVTFRLDLSF